MKGALKDATEALELVENGPSAPHAHAVLLPIFVAMGDRNLACKHARIAVKEFQEPGGKDGAAEKKAYEGLLAYTMNRFKDAIQHFDAALKDAPHVDFAIQYLKFRAMLIMGNGDAKEVVKELVKICPQFAIAKYDLQNLGNAAANKKSNHDNKERKKKNNKKKGNDGDGEEEEEEDGDDAEKRSPEEESGLPFFGRDEWDKAQILCMQYIQEAIKEYKQVVKEAKEKQKAKEKEEKRKKREQKEQKKHHRDEEKHAQVSEEEREGEGESEGEGEGEGEGEEHARDKHHREKEKNTDNKKSKEKKKGEKAPSDNKQKGEKDHLLAHKGGASASPPDAGCCASCVLF